MRTIWINLHRSLLTPQAVFQMGDKDKDDYIDFREFLNYCVEHEKKLWLVFQAMDVNKDGKQVGWF